MLTHVAAASDRPEGAGEICPIRSAACESSIEDRTEAPILAAVLVTYGRRTGLLSEALAALDRQPGVADVVVVDNGCPEPVDPAAWGTSKRAHVVRLDANMGSAAGFAAGLVAARAIPGIAFVLLLDDDNLCAGQAVASLLALHAAFPGRDEVGLAALRPARQDYVSFLAGRVRAQVQPDSFLGFHVMAIPRWGARRLARLLGWAAPVRSRAPSYRMRLVQLAPYGGLFLPVAALDRVAGPDPNFVLYGDDHDFVLRLGRAGVQIYLTDLATVEEAESSWNDNAPAGNPWIAPGAPGWRIYYAVRNRMIVERSFTKRPSIYAANRVLYIAWLGVLARLSRRGSGDARTSFAALLDAVRDGRAGQLGPRAAYRLPFG